MTFPVSGVEEGTGLHLPLALRICEKSMTGFSPRGTLIPVQPHWDQVTSQEEVTVMKLPFHCCLKTDVTVSFEEPEEPQQEVEHAKD